MVVTCLPSHVLWYLYCLTFWKRDIYYMYAICTSTSQLSKYFYVYIALLIIKICCLDIIRLTNKLFLPLITSLKCPQDLTMSQYFESSLETIHIHHYIWSIKQSKYISGQWLNITKTTQIGTLWCFFIIKLIIVHEKVYKTRDINDAVELYINTWET